VVIPTLDAGPQLEACLAALRAQTFQDFETIIVDNSGEGKAARLSSPPRVRVIENPRNAGFGAAVNQGIAATAAEFICTLNDDAYPEPGWLAALAAACEQDPKAGMCASQIRLSGAPDRLDSAGMNIYLDGTAKQRGHGRPAREFAGPAEVLLPSGCAALYRRAALDEAGLFDEDYFLYCEDTDLGLRARTAGWRCPYVPQAVVVHDYSRSAGRASRLKAYYVERNRLFTVIKVFPVILWPLTPFFTLWRYLAHARALWRGEGLASEFTAGAEKPGRLVLIVISAHWDALRRLPSLLRKRRWIRRFNRIPAAAFWRLLRRHAATAREIAVQ